MLHRLTSRREQTKASARGVLTLLAGIMLLGITTNRLLPAGADEANQAETITDALWKYQFRKPEARWEQPDFDDSNWEEGFGGFGTRGTPNARISTVWNKPNIWLRKSVELDKVPAKPALYMYHDEDAEVFINGKRVLAVTGFIDQYRVFPIGDPESASLKAGSNLLAVHCKQTSGGQFIDVHLIDAEHVPSLPKPKRPTTPFQSELLTTWGAEVTAENVWAEYPRPQMVRKHWKNLNGLWNYGITPLEQTDAPEQWDGEILVPFGIESKLSGVQRLLDASEALWYHRTIDFEAAANERVLLNFEAVDYRCKVFVNGMLVGEHVGGSNPFSFDVTSAARNGKNDIVVRVEDETEGAQIRGKQVLDAHGIWYTQVSGIWQTVWMETVAPRHIDSLTIQANLAEDLSQATVKIAVQLAGDFINGEKLRLTIKENHQVVHSKIAITDQPLTVDIDAPKLWSPDTPFLYRVNVAVLDAQGKTVDEVDSYFGVRSVGKVRDSNGHLRLTLNGEEIFHLGPLDQGWWPDGLLTPPSDEAMLYDIEVMKASGFNMIRKHIKVEPRRYYYHCDRLGVMLWQDQPSGGKGAPWTRMRANPTDAQWTATDHAQYMLELSRMIDSLQNHPSIVMWVPFNEAWGQHRTMEVGRWVVNRDPSRLVNIASGGNFWPVGDVADHHNYPHPDFPITDDRFDDYVKVVGEFGGHGYPVDGHLWDANRNNWGYGGLPQSMQEYKDRYVESMRRLAELKKQGIAAGVYTQTTDVEGEINGVMTYDRKVLKIPTDELSKIHKGLVE